MRKQYQIIVIGGSAGSIAVIMTLLPALHTGLKFAIIIVLHRKKSSLSDLPMVFASRTKIPVKEVEDKEPVLPGMIYIAPADYHLLIEKDHTFSLDQSEKINFSRPCIDTTFQAAAEIYKEQTACMLLSGANADGVEGLKYVKQKGGLTVVQSPETAEMPYMPTKAIDSMTVDQVIKADDLAAFITQL